MYHEKTRQDVARARKRLVTTIVAIALFVALLMLALFTVREYSRQQGASSMREAILKSANRCASIEGAYPSDLSYLEDNYGLSINRGDYVITYEFNGGNQMPSVTVVPR